MNKTEKNIHIAGNFEEDKIKMIRELMEEEALEFLCYAMGFPINIPHKTRHKELYNSYQQSKQSKP